MTKRFSPVNKSKRFWLKEIRDEMKLSTREMAQKIGFISWQHYADIEAGRRNPSIELSYKLAEFFNVNVEKFFADRTKFKVEGEEE